MPSEIEEIVSGALAVETLTAKSFIPLVNSSLIYPLDQKFAALAAEGIKRAKHDLPQIKSSDETFHLLTGLATVAAVTRSEALASETRILMRVVRRKPDINIEPQNALRIVLIGAAAHTEISDWSKFVGDALTEIAFEDMSRSEVTALYQFLEILRQLEPALWVTTARADAALWAHHAIAPKK
jgi:hypothetical protein